MSGLDVDALLGAVYHDPSDNDGQNKEKTTEQETKKENANKAPESSNKRGRDSSFEKHSPEPKRKSSHSRKEEYSPDEYDRRRFSRGSPVPPYRRRRRNKRDETPPELSPESQAEQDSRTVFVVGLPTTATDRDLKPFFEQAGKVKVISLISDRNSRRSKGIGYIQYENRSSVPVALGLNGTKFKGHTVSIQATLAEKNRVVTTTAKPQSQSFKIMVSNVDPRLTEEDIEYFFEQVGIVKRCIYNDDYTGNEDGEKTRRILITYKKAEEAKRAVEHCNGFKLLRYELRVEPFSGSSFLSYGTSGETHLDLEGADNEGIRLDGTTRLALMNRLSHRKLDVNLPLSQVASPTLAAPAATQPTYSAAPMTLPKSSRPTKFVILKNMFDPSEADEDPDVFKDVEEAVTEECSKFGTVEEIFTDKKSPDGLVYLKLDCVRTAEQTKSLLDGRWYAGKMVSVDYLTETTYQNQKPS